MVRKLRNTMEDEVTVDVAVVKRLKKKPTEGVEAMETEEIVQHTPVIPSKKGKRKPPPTEVEDIVDELAITPSKKGKRKPPHAEENIVDETDVTPSKKGKRKPPPAALVEESAINLTATALRPKGTSTLCKPSSTESTPLKSSATIKTKKPKVNVERGCLGIGVVGHTLLVFLSKPKPWSGP